jgi:hypothetical protein
MWDEKSDAWQQQGFCKSISCADGHEALVAAACSL